MRNVFRLLVLLCLMSPAQADTTQAYCVLTMGDELSAPPTTNTCTFSQRQGNVSIVFDADERYEFAYQEADSDQYIDQDGQSVSRVILDDQKGLAFHYPDKQISVYWDKLQFQQHDPNNWTWPFTTDEYDATTRLVCGDYGKPADSCPAGIFRMEDSQASIVVLSPAGETFTINIMADYINATNREVESKLVDDNWVIDVDKTETYIIPRAAVEGG